MIDRLSGVDANFIYSETANAPMHTLKVALVEVPGGSPDPLAHLRRELEQRIHLLPPFRKRLVHVPLGFHHPIWVHVPNLDLDQHLHRVVVPAPGGRREMDQVVARIAANPLPRDRPLWQIWLLDGLADGRIGLVAKVHHALADGMASAQLLANVAGHVGVRDESEGASSTFAGLWQVFVDAILEQPRRVAALGPLLRRTLRGATQVLARYRDGATTAPRPFETPRTRFNRGVGPKRSFATASLSLPDVLVVRRAFGVTFNDVILAITSGAVSEYLASRGETPDRSLLATVPISVSAPTPGPRLFGNRLSNLFTSLCTHIADPVERLREIHEVMLDARGTHAVMGLDAMQDWAEYSPPGLTRLALGLYQRLGIAHRHRPPANLIVSSVRGPGQPIAVGDAKLVGLWSVGPVLDGMGLNVTAWSYQDVVGFAVLACHLAVPEAHAISERFAPALAELVAAARREQAPNVVSISPSLAGRGRRGGGGA